MSGVTLMDLVGFLGMVAIISLSLLLIAKMRQISQLKAQVDRFKTALNETDEQAKLIVRTDIELNKTQEELDKKITSLYALQRVSSSISTTLDESQILKKIDGPILEEFGLEKATICFWEENKESFRLALAIGYSQEEAQLVRSFFDSERAFYRDLINSGQTVSSISLDRESEIRQRLCGQFNVSHFVFCPLLPKEGFKGILFVGTENAEGLIGEGDEETIIILANQLSQALENARLFEKAWQAQQSLENKIRERTAELTLALEKVNLANRRKSEFVSNVSHELRTPLTSIKGYASILLGGKLGELPEEIRQRLEKINRHSDELVRFVNDLLDIARIESGKVTMHVALQDLRPVLEEVSDLLSVQAKEKGISLSSTVEEEVKSFPFDAGQIKRVLINLINNAIKFTAEKGSVKVRCYTNNEGAVQVDVTDTGCGIPADAQEKLFEEFYRVDNLANEQIKGTGLGLALAKNIVEAHKGKVWVKSRPNEGSTFSFTLPGQ